MVKKLISTIPPQYEVIVVDDEDLLLAAKRNKGARLSKGEYLFFVDDDNYLETGAIEAALEACQKSEVGVVGFMACYHDRKGMIADGGSMRNQWTGFTRGINTNKQWWQISKQPYEVDEIANAFMVHSELFHELQGLDEKNFPIDLDEADLCKRIKNRGLKVLMVPMARCYHRSQTYSIFPNFRRSMNGYFLGRNKVRYARIHTSFLQFACYLVFFVPIHLGFYFFSLACRGKPLMFLHYLKGTIDGLCGRLSNKYQKR